MKLYKVMIDYKNFIPIDETELEKALRAWADGGKALFNQGATDRIHHVLPDYHAMMGWNYGYDLTPQDYAEIAASSECKEAKNLLASTKLVISGKKPTPPQLSDGVKQLARKMTEPTYDK